MAKGRCNRCYRYWWEHGKERPSATVTPRRYEPDSLCENCGQRPVHAKGRCIRCWSYRHRHGLERPSVIEPPRGADRHNWKGDGAKKHSKSYRAIRRYSLRECERCGAPGELRHHKDENVGNNEPENIEILCRKCHQQHHLGKPPRPCHHCGELSKKLKRGRCNVCYQYLRVNGVDRPQALLARAASRRAVLSGEDSRVAA